VVACDAKIAALERESALLDQLCRGLLEALMTGRVGVDLQGLQAETELPRIPVCGKLLAHFG